MSVYQKPRRGLVVVVCSVAEGRWVGVGRGGIGLERGGHGVPGEKVECNRAALRGSRFGGASADGGSFAVRQVGKAEGNFPWVAFAEAGLMAVSAHRGKFEGIFRTGRQVRKHFTGQSLLQGASLEAIWVCEGSFGGNLRLGGILGGQPCGHL